MMSACPPSKLQPHVLLSLPKCMPGCSPVDDPVGVKVVQRAHQLLRDALHHLFRKGLVVFQDLKQLTLCKLCAQPTNQDRTGVYNRRLAGSRMLGGHSAGCHHQPVKLMPLYPSTRINPFPPVTTQKSVLVSNASNIWMMFSCLRAGNQVSEFSSRKGHVSKPTSGPALHAQYNWQSARILSLNQAAMP